MSRDRQAANGSGPETWPPAGFEVDGYRPGAIGGIAALHGTYYARHWGLGLYFEAKVANDLAAFLLRLDPERDRLWTLWRNGILAGSIAIDGSENDGETAHLRWFILAPDCQGRGLGRAMLDQAVAFCRSRGFDHLYLWTFAGLDAARHLYEAAGFQLAEELDQRQWGKSLREQRFELAL